MSVWRDDGAPHPVRATIGQSPGETRELCQTPNQALPPSPFDSGACRLCIRAQWRTSTTRRRRSCVGSRVALQGGLLPYHPLSPLQPPRPASTHPRLFPRRRSTSPPRSTRKPPSRWFRAPAQAISRPLRGRHPLSSQHSTPRRAATQPMLRLMQTTSWKASHWHRQQLQQQWRAAWRAAWRRAGGGRLSMPQQQAQVAAQRARRHHYRHRVA